MKTFVDSIACAVIRQPSISRCGTRNMISRSLKVPGSDSSALTVRYVGLPVPLARKLALRPIGNPAPPRPRTPAARNSSIRACGAISRARASNSYPPIARYAASLVRSRSFEPASTISRTPSAAIAQLLHDARHVLGPHGLAVAVVDRHDRAPAATAGALDEPQCDPAVRRRLARLDPELLLEGLDDLLRADERA